MWKDLNIICLVYVNYVTKGNKVVFLSSGVEVINLSTQKVILTWKRDKHVYTVDTSITSDENLVCLSV